MPALQPDEARRRLAAARVARLATVRADGRPHVVPIVFDFDGELIRTIADPKPKRGLDLLRHRNIRANPAVSLLVDEPSYQLTRNDKVVKSYAGAKNRQFTFTLVWKDQQWHVVDQARLDPGGSS